MSIPPTEPTFAILPARAALSLAGPDAETFLQGLVSNDVTRAQGHDAVYAALLTAQGKFLFDFFVARGADGALLIDAEAARIDDLARRLKMYKLRSKLEISRLQTHAIAAVWGTGAAKALGLDGAVSFADPRLAEAGVRLILPAHDAHERLAALGAIEAGDIEYDRHRLSLGLPDGSRDIEVEKATLLESGFEELHGVDFAKGCYMGQELTARTKYRGLVKKRLLPVVLGEGSEGDAPPPGTPITLDGKEAGELRSARDGAGIALIRLDAFDRARIEGVPLMAGAVALAAWAPDWMVLLDDSA